MPVRSPDAPQVCWHIPGNNSGMLFSLLPNARHAFMSEYIRHFSTVLRRATPAPAPIPVHRPALSRFLIAGICAWILWQPLKGFDPETATPPAAAITLVSDQGLD